MQNVSSILSIVILEMIVKIDLTKQQISHIVVDELRSQFEKTADSQLADALQLVLANYTEDTDDELQDIVSETAC